MQQAAETLRWTLISMQSILVWWMLRSGLWRRLPMWTAWLAAEAVCRVPFVPTGTYAHQVWKPLQPVLLFLLGCAAIEARYQADRRPRAIFAYALAIVPVGIILPLPDLITLRMWLRMAVAAFLLPVGGSATARWHGRILGALCATAPMFSWIPDTGTAWWVKRVWFQAIFCAACMGWVALFTLRDAVPVPRGTSAE